MSLDKTKLHLEDFTRTLNKMLTLRGKHSISYLISSVAATSDMALSFF